MIACNGRRRAAAFDRQAGRVGGWRPVSRVAAGVVPASDDSRAYAADFRCRGYVDRAIHRRLRVSCVASRRAELRHVPGECERSGSAPRLAVFPVRTHGGPDARAACGGESRVSADARFAEAAAQRLGRRIVMWPRMSLTRARLLPTRARTLKTWARTLLSRDREGAVCLRHKYRHRLPLPLNHISDGCPNVIPIPQPARTSVSRPSSSIRFVRASIVQSPARIRFKVIHHLFGSRFCLHNRVNVIIRICAAKSDQCRCKQTPRIASSTARRPERSTSKDLIHQLRSRDARAASALNRSTSRNVMVPIHGTRFVAVQMRTIARERNQVRHAKPYFIPLPHGRGSLRAVAAQ